MTARTALVFHHPRRPSVRITPQISGGAFQLFPCNLFPQPRPVRCIWLLDSLVCSPVMPRKVRPNRCPPWRGIGMNPHKAATLHPDALTSHWRRGLNPSGADCMPCRVRLLHQPEARIRRHLAPPVGDGVSAAVLGRLSRWTLASLLPPLGPASPPPWPFASAHGSTSRDIRSIPQPLGLSNTPDQRRGVSAILPALPKQLLPTAPPRPLHLVVRRSRVHSWDAP